MITFKAMVREDFGEYIRGQQILLTPTKEYPGYYWVLHPITKKSTTDAVDSSLLFEIKLGQAA